MALRRSCHRDGLGWNLLGTGQRASAGARNSSRCGDEGPVRCGHSSSEEASWPGSRLSGETTGFHSCNSWDESQDLRALGPQGPGPRPLTSWQQDLLNISGWKVPSVLSHPRGHGV